MSREAFRKACLSERAQYSPSSWWRISNTVWLSVPLGVVYAVVLGYVWAYYLDRVGSNCPE